MDRKEFLQALDQALSKRVPARERAEMLRYYEEYFDEAGPEGEASVIESLGDPRALGEKLAAEAGFDAPVNRPAAPKKRRVWPWVVMGAAALLVVLALPLGLLMVNFAGGPSGGPQPSPAVTQSVERIDGDQIANATDEDPLVVESEDHTVVYGRVFRTVDVEVPVADVIVQVGENYGVELSWDGENTYKLKAAVLNGVLRVSANNKGASRPTVDGATVVVSVPPGIELSELNVNVGTGAILLDGIACRELECDAGTGDVTLANVTARGVSVETGVGDIRWEGPLAREVELNSGVGDIHIITDTVGGREVELFTATGDVIVNGDAKGKTFHQWGDSSGELEATTGTGDVTLESGN